MRLFPIVFSLALWLRAAEPVDFFEMRVRPVLANNCFACHTTSHLGGLEVNSREALLKGGNSGPAIVPGKPDESILIQAVSHTHARLKMPPGGKLKEQEIEDLRTWITNGAVWPETKIAAPPGKTYVITPEQRAFWSFQPVRKQTPPAVGNKAWPKGSIDFFVLARLEAKGLQPMRPADKRTLIRRATFDLIGLPPAPEDVDAFLRDNSPDAFRKVVDRLLASPHYGERWGRYWLDIARYSDDKLNSTNDDPYPNSFRYRDWVIQAFNDDMPYNLFVKAQIAGDLLERPDKEKMAAGLGFYGMSPEFQDDRVDATTRGFLGLTVGCATCHDHKFDPIPTKDYYSLLGVFESTKSYDYPLAPADTVEAFEKQKKKVTDKEKEIKDFLDAQGLQLAEIYAAQSAKYLMAARRVMGTAKEDVFAAARPEHLDPETLERLVRYLRVTAKEHAFLKRWDELASSGSDAELERVAVEFQALLLNVNREKKSIDEKNLIRLGGSTDREVLSGADLLSLARDQYILWRDFFGDSRIGEPYKMDSGVFRYADKKIERFLAGEWRAHLDNLRTDLELAKKAMPPQYPFLHAIKDTDKPANVRVRIRGSADNLGEEAPRRFLQILSNADPQPFRKGSGRLELAEAITDPKNPLTARVLVNRIWQHHFGFGIVRTPSNFGQMGERPTHPELLDYLATRLVENHWSIKSLHREMMLSATYMLSAANSEKNFGIDPENRLLWRANRRRLDIEAMRDSLLYAAGELDLKVGGEAVPLTAEKNNRRTIYGFVSRRRLDRTLALFDFPNPNNTSEARMSTNTPVQRMFFMNSGLVMHEADALSNRLAKDAGPDTVKIRRAYRLLFGRDPEPAEIELGTEFLKAGSKAWPRYAQVLLSSNEFYFVN